MQTDVNAEGRYHPEAVLDTVIRQMGLKNDAELARALTVQPPVISKVRRRRTALSDGLLLRIHEESGLSIKELKALMGERPKE